MDINPKIGFQLFPSTLVLPRIVYASTTKKKYVKGLMLSKKWIDLISSYIWHIILYFIFSKVYVDVTTYMYEGEERLTVLNLSLKYF